MVDHQTHIPIAYARGENTSGKRQTLEAHLKGVAERAREFARPFGACDEAFAAGFLHDLGKIRSEFQSYLLHERAGGIDTHHAVYGAAWAFTRDWPASAFAIAGHHSGLHDLHQLQALMENPHYDAVAQLPVLENRLKAAIGDAPSTFTFPSFLAENDPLGLELYIRMVFSCLVDADYLDAENHYSGSPRPPIRLRDCRDQLLNRILEERASKPSAGELNAVRNSIFNQCVHKAETKPGFFSLTVPTGGGKTLSSMAFALAHARRWDLDHVIVVIPYLSIIEQNASEYRRIMDPSHQGIVVEHHSSVSLADKEQGDGSSIIERASENWDAPIVVTTSVQFIESLFASSPAKCRKLHNIARSVVIFDEVQTLPVHLLNPLLSILRELKEDYGASFLFMTATQPAFRAGQSLTEGFKDGEVTEVVERPTAVFETLRRVNFKQEGVLDWKSVAARIAATQQVLCVVNVRRHAFALWDELRYLLPLDERDSVLHLSSAMCPEHRLATIGEIKDSQEGSIRHRLKNGLACRVVATQVVEAGVDIDFPIVLRALGPLDSIVQAGGRCNREGLLVDELGRSTWGEVVVFSPEDSSLPQGTYRTATNITAALLPKSMDSVATNPSLFEEYFTQLFQLTSTDHSGGRECTIQEDRNGLRFREVSRKARVIKDQGVPVIAPYGRGKELIERIRHRPRVADHSRFDRADLRNLQRFMVNVRPNEFLSLKHYRMVSQLLPNLELYVLEEGCYHNYLGLLINQHPTEDLCDV
jgi:CRISPR-associated endonuclease/helicase Cas3